MLRGEKPEQLVSSSGSVCVHVQTVGICAEGPLGESTLAHTCDGRDRMSGATPGLKECQGLQGLCRAWPGRRTRVGTLKEGQSKPRKTLQTKWGEAGVARAIWEVAQC